MAELVGEHGLDFRKVDPSEQGVEEYDALVAADPGEIRVAVRGAARSVHHEDPAAGLISTAPQ